MPAFRSFWWPAAACITSAPTARRRSLPWLPTHRSSTPKDLIGKSIGVPTLVGLATACLRNWLPAHGVDVNSVRLDEIPQSTTLPALQRGTMDAGLLSEPFVTFGKGLVRSVGSPFDAAADLAANKQFCVSVWYASKTWFEADPARARAVVAAIYDTARWQTLTVTTRLGYWFATVNWTR